MTKKAAKAEKLTPAQAAERFGVDERTFRRWVKAGLPVEAKSTRSRSVHWPTALAWYAENRAGSRSSQAAPVAVTDTHPEETIQKAMLRRTKADADLKEHELAVRRRQYLPAGLLEKTIADLATRIRAKLLAVPGKLAPELEGLDKAEMRERLEVEMIHILAELKQPQPEADL